jgi:D-alanyl-D-alanine carboxypeptidase
MRSVSSSRSWTIFRTIAAACALLLVVNGPSEAAKKKQPRKEFSQKRSKKPAAGGGYAPPYAALVVDAKTGKVLHADSPDEIRHPASLTKVMTLYILFEELERGTMTLKTPLKISAEAARQAPSKLGLRPGETIPVEDAIKAVVTKSANDVAVAIGENISGSQAAFAQRMTRQARALGMNSTVYVNSSGLPDPRQVTTARDLVLLGRAIQDNHPNYYGYFSTRNFVWRGQNYGNHNRLVGTVKGVDGIKTGYVRASGFNLLTSANDNNRQIVAVVLGGRSGASRDAKMRELVQANLDKASPGRRTAPLIAAAPMGSEPMPAVALMSERASAPTPAPVFAAAAPSLTFVPHPMPRPAAALPEPVMAAVAAAQPVARVPVPVAAPAPVAALAAEPRPVQPPAVEEIEAPRNPTMTPEAIARRVQLAIATTTPADDTMRWVVGAQPKVSANSYAEGTTPGSPPPRPQPVAEVQTPRPVAPMPIAQASVAPVSVAQAPIAQPPVAQTPKPAPIQMEQQVPVQAGIYPVHPAQMQVLQAPIAAPPQMANAESAPRSQPPAVAAASPAAPARSGWLIQIGATPDPSQAQTLLSRASGAVTSVTREAEPFTEPVEKDGVTLYRARFAGFSERSATAACKAVKRASLSCFTLKN